MNQADYAARFNAYFGPDIKRVVDPGEFEVQVGKNSSDFLSSTFELISKKD